MNQNHIALGYLVFIALLSNCANIGQVDGGPRDTSPPVIDTAASTPLFKTNFKPDSTKEKIELYFGEWIKLQDAQKQIVISPPLQYSPAITPKGKGVIIKFDPREKLLDNTTYTINFGTSIRDLTEGNDVKNLRYVFSTGPVIDSAKISGKIFDAFTGEPKEDFLAMLYTSDADSVLFKTKPIYFSRSDKEGHFSIENIRDTSYSIYILNDANNNYVYDQDKEEIGFWGTRVKNGDDSTSINIPFFKSYIKPKLSNINFEKAGVVKFSANTDWSSLKALALDSTVTIWPGLIKDTIAIYYTPALARNWNLEIRHQNAIVDTILINRVRINSVDSFTAQINWKEIKSLAPASFRTIEFNLPLLSVDTTLLKIINDTTKAALPVKIQFNKGQNKFSLLCECLENNTYTLHVLPHAVKSIFNQPLADTLVIKTMGMKNEQYGNIVYTINNLDSTKNYYFALMQDEEELFIESIARTTTHQLSYNYLIPGNYSIKIVQDDNENKKWDTGNLKFKTQPEKIVINKNLSVRSNWELREEINWKP